MRNLLKFIGWFLVSALFFDVVFWATGVEFKGWWQPYVLGFSSGLPVLAFAALFKKD